MIYAPVINQWMISPQNVVTARLTHTSWHICEMQKGMGAEPPPCHVHTRPWTRTPGVGIWTCERWVVCTQLGRWLLRCHLFSSWVCVFLPCAWCAALFCLPQFISSIPFCACLHVWWVRFFHSLKVIWSGQFSPESLKASGGSGKSH